MVISWALIRFIMHNKPKKNKIFFISFIFLLFVFLLTTNC